MEYTIHHDGKFKFIEEGEGEPLVLLHGLFGALSNFEHLVSYFKTSHKVVVPMLPLFDLDLLHTTVGGLQKFVAKFVESRGYKDIHPSRCSTTPRPKRSSPRWAAARAPSSTWPPAATAGW